MGRVVAVMFPLPPNRYLAATCGLCGYTEFYHLAIADKASEREAAPAGRQTPATAPFAAPRSK